MATTAEAPHRPVHAENNLDHRMQAVDVAAPAAPAASSKPSADDADGNGKAAQSDKKKRG